MFYKSTRCRACDSTKLVEVLNLGLQPLANNFVKPGAEVEGYAPLVVNMCMDCTLAQLSVVVQPEILYRHYSYVTSKSATMKAHFDKITSDIMSECATLGPKLLEIGSNDGTFLQSCQHHTFGGLVGFEPAKNLAEQSAKKGIHTVNQLFGADSAIYFYHTCRYDADVIVARHVFCHVDYWQDFIRGLEILSHKDTLIFIEVPYVGDMLKANSFDQCYHEHLSYMSFTAMKKLLDKTSLRVHRVIHYDIHGGAVGIMLRHREWAGAEHSSITEYSMKESPEKLYGCWLEMANRSAANRAILRDMILNLKSNNKTVCAFGASAKATVWMNACGFTSRDIAFVCDETPEKQGRLVPGTDIPVVPESRLSEAGYAVNFAWNFHAAIAEKHKDWKGRFIIPVPEVVIV